MMSDVPRSGDERSVGELLADLSREVTTLVREELRLAKAEMSQKASNVGKDVGMIAAGAAIAYAGMLALVAALVIILATVGVPWWASALLVGVIVTGVGGFLAWKGMQALKREDLVPHETIESLKEDVNEPASIRRRAA